MPADLGDRGSFTGEGLEDHRVVFADFIDGFGGIDQGHATVEQDKNQKE